MKERCPCCKREIDYSLITTSPDPYAEAVCYDCLSDELKAQYDAFFGESYSAKKLDTSTTENRDSSMPDSET